MERGGKGARKRDGFTLEELKVLHRALEPEISARLKDFDLLRKKGDEDRLFGELTFCLLTPQSRARSCWAAVESLEGKGLIFEGEPVQIQDELWGVRFKYRKAEYVCLARERLRGRIGALLEEFDDPRVAREWLVANVKGMGYKEASHFLRNVGLGRNLAILDRHVLKNLVRLGVIEEVPTSMTKRRYLQIEERMGEFARRAEIPMDHLDFLLWYREVGEVFK